MVGAIVFSVLLTGCGNQKQLHEPFSIVTATIESDPVPNDDDAADDAAIWVNYEDPGASLVLATDKRGGLQVLDLSGKELWYFSVGRLNNVDIRIDPNRQDSSLAVATRREPSELVFFSISHENGEIRVRNHVPISLETPYGVCASVINNEYYVIVNDKNGQFNQYVVIEDRVTLIHTWHTSTQPEGCVVDDIEEVVYYGEEEVGIWKISADPHSPSQPQKFAAVGSGDLVADVEGLALYKNSSETYLLVSSQGSNSYSVFDTQDRRFLGSFQIGNNEENGGVDGTSDTDGVAITSYSLPGFSGGMLVVQDGENTDLSELKNQNFKFVQWKSIFDKLFQ